MNSHASRIDSRLETLRAEASKAGDSGIRSAATRYEQQTEQEIAGRYKLIKQIGSGGMGVVYLALDQKLERHVAIKRLVVKSYNARTVQRRFLREAQTIAALGHFNIVNLFDIGQDEHGHYIIMEYVPGPTLTTKAKPSDPPMPMNLHGYVSSQGPMKLDLASQLIRQVANALEYAHNKGIIHRDIKPTNILLNPNFDPKLVDFGLARPINLAKSEEITLAGSILGTPEYCAPEQWGDASTVDVRADIYAMAGVIWYALTGRSPRYFREKDVDPKLGPILSKALAAKPEERYSTAGEFLVDFEATEEPEEPPPAPNTQAGGTTSMLDSSATQGFWSCRNCELNNPDTAKFCIHCGASGLETCPNCGNQFRVGLQHCPGCGVDIKVVEESANQITTAKNHAAFSEYETALSYLSENIRNSNPEARALHKEWREKVLRRRNLLMEFDSSLRVFNHDKAIDIAVELQDMVPEECLSESEDFKVTSSFGGMMSELRQMLVEAANRAKADFNLAKFTQNIQYLNRVFGDDVCHVINQELYAVERSLDDALTKAGLAAGMNCFTHAQEVLETVDPWKGGELGNRRLRLQQTCDEFIELRDEAIACTERAIQEGRFSEALVLVKDMVKFRLPPNNSEVSPAAGDKAAQDRMIRIDKALTQTIEANINEWVVQNDWGNIVNALQALKGSESSAWKKLGERLRNSANSEIINRYNSAVEFEKKGKFRRAQKAWEDFLAIPQQITPSNLYQFASDYRSRCQVHARRHAQTVLRRSAIGIGVTWIAYVVSLFIIFIADDNFIAHELLTTAIPAVAAFLIGGVLLGISLTRKFKRHESKALAAGRSPKITMLSALLLLSPIPFLLALPMIENDPSIFYFYPSFLAGIGFLFWDMIRKDGLPFPANFSSVISWAIAAPAGWEVSKLVLSAEASRMSHITVAYSLRMLVAGFVFGVVLLLCKMFVRDEQPAAPSRPVKPAVASDQDGSSTQTA